MNFFSMSNAPWMQPPCMRGMGGGYGQGFFGGGRQLGYGLAGSMMGHCAHGMWGGWGGFGQHGHHGHHHHDGGVGGGDKCHGGHGAHAQHGEGGWDAAKGGYVVGKGGQLDVKVGKSDAANNNKMQYRVGEGDWKDIGYSKSEGTTASIKAPPGSTVQFRINSGGDNFQAGTTKNVDGIDHGRVSTSNGKTQLSFEDQRGGGDRDYNDARIEITNARRRH